MMRVRSFLLITGIVALLAGFPASVYADGICLCPPSIIAIIDGTNYSNSFSVATTSQGFTIGGGVSTPLFQFSLTANTTPDPGIAFNLSIIGDPTVAIIITQTFPSGSFPNFFLSGVGTITDANQDGHASSLGSPFIETAFLVVDGVGAALVGQMNTGCNLTGVPGFTSPCPVAQSLSTDIGGSPLSALVLDIGFTLSDGDAATLTGSTILAAPEPHTGLLLGSGGLVLAGLALRRKSRESLPRI